MSLKPGERASVLEVQPGGAAGKAGLKAGDRIARLGGQPILSIADVEWALYVAADEGDIAAELEGGGTLKIPLARGWRNP
jgi:serine protease Do